MSEWIYKLSEAVLLWLTKDLVKPLGLAVTRFDDMLTNCRVFHFVTPALDNFNVVYTNAACSSHPQTSIQIMHFSCPPLIRDRGKHKNPIDGQMTSKECFSQEQQWQSGFANHVSFLCGFEHMAFAPGKLMSVHHFPRDDRIALTLYTNLCFGT